MRNLIRRNSTKKLFVSKPEIKQTNDKVIITAYTADREKDFLLRKLYFFNKSFKTAGKSPASYISALKNIFLKAKTTLENSKLVSTAKINETYLGKVLPLGLSRKLGKFSRLHIRNTGKNFAVSSFKRKFTKRSFASVKRHTIRKNLFRNRLAISIIKKKNFLKNLFFYSFLK
jgi:CHASE2 domain-containing sensor protein